MSRVGFFAGAFDPIHDGHVEVMRSAVEFLELNNLLVLVESRPWTSKKPVAVKHRQVMVDLSLLNEPNIAQLILGHDRFDLQTTLPQLEKRYPKAELYFIFGADVFVRMNHAQWPDLDKLLRHYIVVFERAGLSEKVITEHAKQLGVVTAILPSKHLNHASSNVRMHSYNKDLWIPKPVAEYIQENNLY